MTFLVTHVIISYIHIAIKSKRNILIMSDIDQQLTALQRIQDILEYHPPIDQTPQISTTQPLIISYKGRRHLFLWSPNSLTLTIEDIGTLTVAANTWINISYAEGMRLVPVNQANTVPIYLRATNEVIP